MTRADLDKQPADVRRMFDAVAERYDVTNDVLSMGQDRRWRTAVVEAVAAGPGERVLDLAAGTGTSSEPFVQAAGEHRVGDVVALRDPVEHGRDVGRPLVQTGPEGKDPLLPTARRLAAGPERGPVCAVSPVSHDGDATGLPTLGW